MTKNNLPNIPTTKSVEPFNMFGFEMPGGIKTENFANSQRNFFSKVFYKNYLNKNPDMAKKFNFYFDYMMANKIGTNQYTLSKTVRDVMNKRFVNRIDILESVDVKPYKFEKAKIMKTSLTVSGN